MLSENPRCWVRSWDSRFEICEEFYLKRTSKEENFVYKERKHETSIVKRRLHNQTLTTITFWPFPSLWALPSGLFYHCVLQSSLHYGQTIWPKFLFILKTCRAYHLNYDCNKGEQTTRILEDREATWGLFFRVCFRFKNN